MNSNVLHQSLSDYQVCRNINATRQDGVETRSEKSNGEQTPAFISWTKKRLTHIEFWPSKDPLKKSS